LPFFDRTPIDNRKSEKKPVHARRIAVAERLGYETKDQFMQTPKNVGRLTLGVLVVAGVIASSAVFVNRTPYTQALLVQQQAISDTAQYAMAVKFPAIRAEIIAKTGVKDMPAFSERLDADQREISSTRNQVNRRLLLDAITISASLAAFVLAGMMLIGDALRGRKGSTVLIA